MEQGKKITEKEKTMSVASVIKYEGPHDVLVWKHPVEDFNTASQLIVHESQEAIFFKNGQALDLFPAGRYALESANLPVLGRIINRLTGGESPFHCEVYFINKAVSLDVKWGTSSPIPVMDPQFNIIVPVRANGRFGIRIDDSRKLLVKLLGTIEQFDYQAVQEFFRGGLMTRIKDFLAGKMVREKISFLEITTRLNEISASIQEQLSEAFEEYGIKLVNFFVNTISVPDDDEGVLQVKSALAKRAEMGIIGYDYRQERSFDVLQEAAGNTGTAGGLIGAGLGLGMGVNVGNTVGSAMMEQMVDTGKNGAEVQCRKCGNRMSPDAVFCPKCGEKKAVALLCIHCSAELTEGAVFCSKCGKRQSMSCPSCHAELPPDALFCPKCGHKQQEVVR